MSDDLLARLAEGDMRTTGVADEVAARISHDQALFDRVFGAIRSADAGLAMRSADAVEKAARLNPALLAGHVPDLLELARDATRQEVQWHVAQMLDDVPLTESQQDITVAALKRMFTESKSKIVQAAALQPLVQTALKRPDLLPQARVLVESALASGAPSVRGRACKLAAELAQQRYWP